MFKRLNVTVMLASLLLLTTACSTAPKGEGQITPHLSEPSLTLTQVYKNERFPNITVTPKGTLITTWGNKSVIARRSEDGGKTWGPVITIAKPGFQGGGLTVDETTGDILAFVEEKHPIAPLTIYRSKDDGLTWTAQKHTIKRNSLGHVPSMHMNETGLTLQYGKHKGRLIRPTRYYGKSNSRTEWPDHYTNAMYSDDGGYTWQNSEPFPENGTGEAAIVELTDGRLYYNSRVHWEKAENNIRRRHAFSYDGGKTWKDWEIIQALPDGRQDRSYGCMGGLTRLPIAGRDVLIFSNIDTPKSTRERATVWASFDGGKTWPVKRLVYNGPSGYSSLTAGRAGTPTEGWIYLLFEGGPGGGANVAKFNLAWLIKGESTGDGEIPNWVHE